MRILSLLIIPALLIVLNQKTQSPHGADFKVSCKTCHSSKGWQLDKETYSFDHNTTKFPLVGRHTDVNCKQCHQTLIFKGAKNKCNECHIDVHKTTTGPDCSRCHTPNSWLVNNISEIHQMSHFPLLGAHKTADCIQCHKSESQTSFDVAGINCIDCHRQNYMATTNPNHIQAGFSEDCYTCHPSTSMQWSGAGFNHSFFALVQGHATPKCSDCHTTGRYSDAKTDCYSCHQKDYTSTTDPNHSASSFPTTCGNCHTLNPGWKPASFDHGSFPLTLGHSNPKCIDCHTSGTYSSLSTDCYTCHQKDYAGTNNPNHSASGFSTVCTQCHTTNPGWTPAKIDHSKFPLTLGHSGPKCTDCHINGNYASTSSDCYSCHQKDFQSTTNPNHSTSGFSTVCTQCHTTNPGWKPTTFNHSSFALTLGHSTPTCNDCHKGNYTSTSSDCITCHQVDYNKTVNPNHQTLGFSSVCTQCHTTNPGWKPASYLQHDSQSFPIYSGKHRNQWNSCTDCHSNPSSYAQFTCISCHEHNKTDMDNKHQGRSGYSYTSAACFQCHPRGTSD